MFNASIKAIFFDLSGVLYDGSQHIDGAVDTVAEARRRGLTLRFVTNTASKGAAKILDDLYRMGFDIPAGELYTAPIAARDYVKAKGLRPYCLIHRALINDFAALDQSNPNCVILGDARDDLHYQSMNRAFGLCMEGAPLIAIGMNKYFKDDGGLKLDAGAFAQAIGWAAGIEPIVMGKPNADFFQQVVQSTSHSASECLMIGDDVCADVQGAIDAGLCALLVRTGKFRAGDEQTLPESAGIIDSVADVFSY